MSYGLIYTIPFATLSDIPCVVEIEKEDYTGRAVELTAGVPPFTVDIEDEEFLYTPTRFSTARIQVAGSDYLQSLFSTEYRQYRVTFKKDGVITWCGFIKPELYTQDYVSDTFVMELECISAMSVLEFIDYTLEGKDKSFVSLWKLLQKCISASRGGYNAVYIPHVYASNKSAYTSGENVLDKMTVSEQNFFDEDDKPMKLKEVLEEVCKLLNWTCTDWKGELYFVDVDHSGVYHKYDISMTNKTEDTPNFLNAQSIGYSGTGHSLDILSGYNKASVKCSNYPIDTILPEEEYKDLEELKTIDDKKADQSQVCRSIYCVPKKWSTDLYDTNGSLIPVDKLSDYKDVLPSLQGTTLVRSCTYKQKKTGQYFSPEITDYSFIDTIRVRQVDSKELYVKAMSFKLAPAFYSNCAIAISGEVKVMEAEDMIPFGNSENGTMQELACKIRIGNKYFGNPYGEIDTGGFTWSENEKNFVILTLTSFNNDKSLDWIPITNRKELSMPYTGLSGVIAPITNLISGDLEFTLLAERRWRGTGSQLNNAGLYIKDFKVTYQKEDGISKTNDNTDRTYENTLNESYINELDEIEFKISSYNEDGACYSKVLLNGDYLRDNLYNTILDTTIRPEEMIITRIINHYSATRIKLTQVIKNSDEITPLTKTSDDFLVSKKFINAGGSIDYANNRFEYIMIEV